MTHEQKRARAREYERKYREANRDKRRESAHRYAAANKEKIAAKIKAWAAANPEKRRESDRAWKQSNRDLVNQRAREYRRERRRNSTPETRAAHASYMRKYYSERPGLLRARNLKQLYGISIEQYDSLLELQGGVCAVCRIAKYGRVKDGKEYPLSVDHCHKTGRIRGLLCDGCNRGLGLFKDDPERLRLAINYLAS